MIQYSTSQLIKQSAAQTAYLTYKYLFDKIEKQPTVHQINGLAHQKKIAQEKKLSDELRGTLCFNTCMLHFCIDGYKNDSNTFYEIKSTQFEIKDWYYEQSIIHAMFLEYALRQVDVLYTPLFLRKQGYKLVKQDVKKPFNFILNFGNDEINIKGTSKVYDFYIRKLHIINKCITFDEDDELELNLDFAKKYDLLYKHKEYSILIPEKYKKQ